MAIDPAGAIPPLDWLRSFEAAARHASFTAAARELGLTQAAISQHIRHLEHRLRRRLFERRARGVDVTPDGAAYLPHIQAAVAAIANSTQELFDSRVPERIVLRSPVSFATLMLSRWLPALSRDMPFLRLQVETIHRPGDYSDGFEGLDIRFGDGVFPGRAATRLTTESLVPVAAPALLGNAEWTTLPLLGVLGARGMWRDWFAKAGTAPPLRMAHRFDTFVAAFEAARAGAGVLLGSRPLVDLALAQGSLVTLSDVALRQGNGHFLTAPAGRIPSRAEMELTRWLADASYESFGFA